MEDFDQLLREMEAFAEKQHVPIIWESGRQAFIDAVDEAKPHRILEIGTAIGYSALLMLAHAAEDAEITTLELSPERYEQAKAYIARSPYAGRVHQLLGDAGELLTQLDGPYDLVFIDAAKGQYPDYLHKVLPLLAPDAVILADNVLFRGYVRGGIQAPRRFRTIVKRLRAYIDEVEHLPGAETEILEHGDGLAMTRFRRNNL